MIGPFTFRCACQFTKDTEFSDATLLPDSECGYHASMRRRQAPRTEEQRKYVEIGMLHRRRTGEVDFHQEVFSIPLALHGTLKVFMEASVFPPRRSEG